MLAPTSASCASDIWYAFTVTVAPAIDVLPRRLPITVTSFVMVKVPVTPSSASLAYAVPSALSCAYSMPVATAVAAVAFERRFAISVASSVEASASFVIASTLPILTESTPLPASVKPVASTFTVAATAVLPRRASRFSTRTSMARVPVMPSAAIDD